MWPLPSYKNELVTITICPQYLTCSWIKSSNKQAPLQLCAYERFDLDHLELEKLIVFNPTAIKKHINTFTKKHRLHNAPIACALAGPQVSERLLTLNTLTPQPEQVVTARSPHMRWEYRYLYPHDNGNFVFYRCGIPQPLLLQYKLLATRANLNLLTLTTERMALLTLYKYLYGSAFRQSQLAVHMMQRNNMIEQLFSPETLARILHVPDKNTTLQSKELLPLLSSCGLFVSEGINV